MSSRLSRVLVIDDDVVVRTLLPSYLKGFHSVVADSAEDGLEKAKNGYFDVIITDFHLPGRNGLEFVELLRQDIPDVPIILITAFSNTRVIRAAWMMGVFDFFEKPLDRYRVLETVMLAASFGQQNNQVTRGSFFPSEVAVASKDSKVIDLEIVSGLLESLDHESLKMLLSDFEEQNLIDFSQLKKAHEDRNFHAAVAVCHRMAGSFSNLGLIEAERICRDLEEMGRAEEELAWSKLPMIEKAYQEAFPVLRSKLLPIWNAVG